MSYYDARQSAPAADSQGELARLLSVRRANGSIAAATVGRNGAAQHPWQQHQQQRQQYPSETFQQDPNLHREAYPPPVQYANSRHSSYQEAPVQHYDDVSVPYSSSHHPPSAQVDYPNYAQQHQQHQQHQYNDRRASYEHYGHQYTSGDERHTANYYASQQQQQQPYATGAVDMYSHDEHHQPHNGVSNDSTAHYSYSEYDCGDEPYQMSANVQYNAAQTFSEVDRYGAAPTTETSNASTPPPPPPTTTTMTASAPTLQQMESALRWLQAADSRKAFEAFQGLQQALEEFRRARDKVEYLERQREEEHHVTLSAHDSSKLPTTQETDPAAATAATAIPLIVSTTQQPAHEEEVSIAPQVVTSPQVADVLPEQNNTNVDAETKVSLEEEPPLLDGTKACQVPQPSHPEPSAAEQAMRDAEALTRLVKLTSSHPIFDSKFRVDLQANGCTPIISNVTSQSTHRRAKQRQTSTSHATTPDECDDDGNTSAGDESISQPHEHQQEQQQEEVSHHAPVIAIDCEMIETTEDDMALARVSAVGYDGACIADYYVLPCHPDFIVDCRTGITGIVASHLQSQGVSLMEAIDRFRALVGPETVLVGHAVHHDLLALRSTHSRVIDSALLYPVADARNERDVHSLEHLSQVVLKRSMQRKACGGVHDSVEDARIALDLVKHLANTTQGHELSPPLPKRPRQPRRAGGAGRSVMGTGVRAHLQLANAMTTVRGGGGTCETWWVVLLGLGF
jgi:DNA polymerase III epsilon subunit-like protein